MKSERQKINRINMEKPVFFLAMALAIVVLVSGCVDIDSYLSSVPPTIIERTETDHACFGDCVRNLTINSNRAVFYYERSSYAIVNQSSSIADKGKLSELLHFYQKEFFLLNDTYSCRRNDVQNVTKYYFRNDTVNKTVTVYGNCVPVRAFGVLNVMLDDIRDKKISYKDKNLYAVFNRTIADIRLRIAEIFSPKSS